MNVDLKNVELGGWIRTGPKSYRHHCGARVAQLGRFWTATGITGFKLTGQVTAQQAMSSFEKSDSSFWSYGNFAFGGRREGVWFKLGYLDANRANGISVIHMDTEDGIPVFMQPVFRRLLFGESKCAKCLRLMDNLRIMPLTEFDGLKRKKGFYLVCHCGFPGWSVDADAFSDLGRAVTKAGKEWRRRQRVVAAGGVHTAAEIQEVLSLQENRCIYCNILFTNECRATKDHLLAVVDGGSSGAMNIVMACRSCNARRCDIPFRTYCMLLSPKQNLVIKAKLRARCLTAMSGKLPEKALICFTHGLTQHNATHWRFLDIQDQSSTARKNVLNNKLLSKTVHSLLASVRAL